MWSFIVALIIGGLSGWLAGKIMGTSYSVIINIILGLVGGLVGNFLFSLLGLGTSGIIWEIIASAAGACVVIWLVRKFDLGRFLTK